MNRTCKKQVLAKILCLSLISSSFAFADLSVPVQIPETTGSVKSLNSTQTELPIATSSSAVVVAPDEFISIKQAKSQPTGTQVKIKGVLTDSYYQDLIVEDAGVAIFVKLKNKPSKSYSTNQIVELTGVVTQRGEFGSQIAVDNGNVANLKLTTVTPAPNSSVTTPKVVTVEEMNEEKFAELEGVYVTLQNVLSTPVDQVTQLGSLTNKSKTHTIGLALTTQKTVFVKELSLDYITGYVYRVGNKNYIRMTKSTNFKIAAPTVLNTMKTIDGLKSISSESLVSLSGYITYRYYQAGAKETDKDSTTLLIQDETGAITLKSSVSKGLFNNVELNTKVNVEGVYKVTPDGDYIEILTADKGTVLNEPKKGFAPTPITVEKLNETQDVNGKQERTFKYLNERGKFYSISDVYLDKNLAKGMSGKSFDFFIPSAIKQAIGNLPVYHYQLTGYISQYKGNMQIQITDYVMSEPLEIKPSVPSGFIKLGDSVTFAANLKSGMTLQYATASDPSEFTSATVFKDYAVGTPIQVTQNTKNIQFIIKKDGQAVPIPTNFTYNFVSNPKIADIQGETHKSPLIKAFVKDIEGVVTEILLTNYDYGFYMQSRTPDSNPKTSEGIYVNLKKSMSSTKAKEFLANLKRGSIVSVSGTVEELMDFNGNESINFSFKEALSVTTITPSVETGIVVNQNEKALISPVKIGLGGLTVPNNIDTGAIDATFDPTKDAVDFYESLEGMLVEIVQPKVLGKRERIDKKANKGTAERYSHEVYLLPKGVVLEKAVALDNGGYKLVDELSSLKVIKMIDKANRVTAMSEYIDFATNPSKLPNVGDYFVPTDVNATTGIEAGNVQGVISYDFNDFVLLNSPVLPKLVKGTQLKRETETKIVPDSKKITIASYNVENFNAGETEKAASIANRIVRAMKKPDVICLIEMQDNDGEGKMATSEADKTFDLLINAVNTELKNTGETNIKYDYVQINPEYNVDGGASGANIRVGFIYRTDRLNINKQKADFNTKAVVTSGGSLSVNPSRIITNETVLERGEVVNIFDGTRKSLVVEFKKNDTGESIFVIGNHLSSKTGTPSNFNYVANKEDPAEHKRNEQARVVNEFVNSILKINPNANIAVMGDMNDYEFSKTLHNLEGQTLANMIEEDSKLPQMQRYAYMHNGNSQVLDHILIPKHALKDAEIDVITMNAMFGELEGRISDHDPVLIQMSLKPKSITPNPNTGGGGGDGGGDGGGKKPSKNPDDNKTPQVSTEPKQTAVTLPDPSKATTAKTADQVAKETKANEIKQKVTELNKDVKDNKALKKALKSATDNVVDKSAVQKMIVQEKNSSKLKSAEFTELVKTAKQEVRTLEKEINSKKTLELTIPISVQKNNTLALDASIIQTLKSQEVFVEVNSELGKLTIDGKKITTESLDIQLSEASKTAEVMVNGVKKSSKAVEVKITSNNAAVTQQSNMVLPIEANKQPDQLMMMKFNPETNTWNKVKSVVTEEGLKASVNNGVYTMVEVTSTQFKDVNKHWASQVIQKLETRGVMNGVAADQFKPDATITKGEFLAAVLNNYGVDSATKGANWVDGYLAEASKQGINIVTAKDSNKAITREEMALIIAQAYKAFEGVTPEASAGAFKDLKKVNESSQQAINLMKTLGIVNGYSDGSFKPEATGSRAEAAQMLFKLMTVSN